MSPRQIAEIFLRDILRKLTAEVRAKLEEMVLTAEERAYKESALIVEQHEGDGASVAEKIRARIKERRQT